MKKWVFLALLMVAGCGRSPALLTPNSDTVVADLGNSGGPSIAVKLAAVEGNYTSQALVHRWVEADIYQYEATLKLGGQSLTTVVVPRKGTPKTTALFTNLRQGQLYEVAVVAKGNVGGTQADTVLNQRTQTVARFDFTAPQDTENSAHSDVQVSLDPVAFNGSGDVTILPPQEGGYANPTDPEVGVAQ